MTHNTKRKFYPVYSNGAYRLTNPNGDTLMMPINDKYLKKYHPWSCLTHLRSKKYYPGSCLHYTSDHLVWLFHPFMEHSSLSEVDFNSLCLVGWISVWDPRCLRERQRRIYFFKRIASPPTNIQQIKYQYPANQTSGVKDARCQHWRIDKCKLSVLASSLFSTDDIEPIKRRETMMLTLKKDKILIGPNNV